MDQFGFFEIFAAGLALFYSFITSYGLAIILLTLLVRILLLPLSIKQTRSMREMAVIQPEVKKLQAKYKGNRQKMNEEMMALYKEHGVNPLGGCLPLLMQFPILIALFQVLRSPLKYLGENTTLFTALEDMPLAVHRFLGLRLDCTPLQVYSGTESEAVNLSCGSGVVSFVPYLLIILVIGFTTYYQQKQMMARQPESPQAQQMQTFARIMPIVFMVFSLNFPTGMAIYFLTTNLWTIVQQRIILKAAPIPEPPAKTKGGKSKVASTSTGSKAKGSGKSTAKKTGRTSENGKGSKPQTSSSAPRSRPSSKKKRR